jgi:hypothetical protein
MEWRVMGLTYHEIGKRMGVSQVRAYQLVKAGLMETQKEVADELRQITHNRLTFMFGKLIPGIVDGDPQAVNAAVNVIKQYKSMFGLDQPTKHEVTGKDGGPLAMPVPITEQQSLQEVVRGLMGVRTGDITDLKEKSGEKHKGNGSG